MKITVITPNKNGAKYLDDCLASIDAQVDTGVDLEWIVVDGGSSDGSAEIIDRYRDRISLVIAEPDRGPVDAINKGLRIASGDVCAWLNADDRYHPGALRRACETMERNPGKALCFGPCRIIDGNGEEIRKGITRFKEAFFPLSSRFTIQCLNYVSQPSLFFRRSAMMKAGLLHGDLVAAWDYDYLLRLWPHGGAARIEGGPVADFRWHDASISANAYATQFREEADIASRDAGRWSLQSLIHGAVRWGIVASYGMMQRRRRRARGIPGKPDGVSA